MTELEREAAAFGIDPETLPKQIGGDGIWPDHLPALEAFFAVCGQWRQSPKGRFIGLDYTAVRAGLDLAGIEVTPDMWSDVQLIETGARRALNGDDG